ncbi:GNAT family N-acetyltransferase [Agrobacterium tumefaciens]|uniref:GNAT family N-acetyltransferase n=1 Tax=Agrobacterium tumefaciens TaxID=358 RepID=UPI001ADD2840|nr:GNAT family N-acetyltransferase [Agrobacterium tumefaciens]QTK79927.1 GNAT family N-acetyltransferase [Agrobacterium tumefaciens]
MTVEIKSLSGIDATSYFDDLARLRIEVFRAFPYLYDGSLDYERKYLSTYADTDGAVFVLALDDGRVVGMSTGMPMAAETDEVKAPFVKAGYDPDRIFYFGESVLLPGYRGHGVGVRFFEEREAHAKGLGFDQCTFCAVERPADHRRRPSDYVPLNAFWEKRGYRHHPELRTSFTWQDLDETSESPKTLSFWMKPMAGDGNE